MIATRNHEPAWIAASKRTKARVTMAEWLDAHDAPGYSARNWCNAPRLADAATGELRRWLARGPYVLELTGMCDFYGRAIGSVRRGSEDVRDVLVNAGVARRDGRNYRERVCR